MAGGMGGRGESLARRTTPGPRHDTADCPARHCWVGDPVDHSAQKRPGLLLEWRSTPGGWEGRVTYAAQARPGSWALVEEWLPAEALTRT